MPKLAPRGPQEEDNGEVLYLMGRIKTLAKSGLTIIEVMSICIMRGVQPLQYRGHPLWCFNGEDDATRCGRKGPDTAAALAKILSELFKGEEDEFIRIKPRDGFSMYNPPSWVSYIPLLPSSRVFCCMYSPCQFTAGTAKGHQGGLQPFSTTGGP